jgi:capping protein (actin filament) muscle Z-line, alpha
MSKTNFAEAIESGEKMNADDTCTIVGHFLVSAPPGEIKEIESDIRRLVLIDVVKEVEVKEKYKQHNVKHLTVSKTPGGTLLLICDIGEIAQDIYCDPTTQKLWSFDHKTLLFSVSGRTADPTSFNAMEETRESLQNMMNSYIRKQYKNTNSVMATAAVFCKDNNALEILVSGAASDLRNYWSGAWRTRYSVNILDGYADISGNCDIFAHYFEDGNVQMRTMENFETKILPFSEKNLLGCSIVDEIRSYESALHSSLRKLYAEMARFTFKDMRRILPITKQKFDWSGVQSKLFNNQEK